MTDGWVSGDRLHEGPTNFVRPIFELIDDDDPDPFQAARWPEPLRDHDLTLT